MCILISFYNLIFSYCRLFVLHFIGFDHCVVVPYVSKYLSAVMTEFSLVLILQCPG